MKSFTLVAFVASFIVLGLFAVEGYEQKLLAQWGRKGPDDVKIFSATKGCVLYPPKDNGLKTKITGVYVYEVSEGCGAGDPKIEVYTGINSVTIHKQIPGNDLQFYVEIYVEKLP